jgi:hypothetical protein
MSSKRPREENNNEEYFICPISNERIKNAVVLTDGYSYDKEVIIEWLKKNDTSPITNNKLDNKNIIVNRLLDQLIRQESCDFNCSICGQLMTNPMLVESGYTYECDSIKKWLKKKNRNPLTNEILTNNKLVPNRTIQSIILYSSSKKSKTSYKDVVAFSMEIDKLTDNCDMIGIVKAITVSNYDRNHNMYMKVCEALEKSLKNKKHTTINVEIINAGGIEAIVDIMKLYNTNYSDSDSDSDTRIYESVCRILSLLADKESIFKQTSYEVKIIDSGCIDVIMTIITTNISNDSVLVAMCMTLCNLTKIFPKLVDKIIDANYIKVIISIMEKYDNHCELLKYTNEILANLAITEDNMASISIVCGIEAVIKTIENAMSRVKMSNKAIQLKVIESGCKAIRIFIAYNKILQSNMVFKLIDCICCAIKQNWTKCKITEHTLQTILIFIKADENNKKMILNYYQYHFFINIIKRYYKYNNYSIISSSFLIFVDLFKSYNKPSNSYYDLLLINIIVKVMEDFPRDEQIQHEGIYIINNFIQQKKTIINNVFIDSGAISVFITTIKIHTSNSYIVINASNILNDLIEVSDDKKFIDDRLSSIITGNSIMCLVNSLNKLMEANENINDEILNICLLIQKLCSISNIYTGIIAIDCFNVFLSTLKKYTKDSRINLFLNVLERLYIQYSISENTGSENVQSLKDTLEFEDLKTIVDVMKEHINDAYIQKSGCSIFSKWSYNKIPHKILKKLRLKDNNQNTIVEIGVFDAIMNAMNTHTNDALVHANGYNALTMYIQREGQIAIDKVIKERGIELSIKGIREHFENLNVTNSACRLLAFLCVCPDNPSETIPNEINQKRIINEGGIYFAINILKRATDNIESGCACHLLANISWNNKNSVDLIIQNKGIKTILIAMKKSNEKGYFLRWASILLNNLTHNEDSCFEFALAGGIQLIVNIIKSRKHYKYIYYFLKLLLRISKIDKLLISIYTAGGTSCILEFIQICMKYKIIYKVHMIHEYLSKIINNLIKELNDNDIEMIKLIEDILTRKDIMTIMTIDTQQRYNDIISTFKKKLV